MSTHTNEERAMALSGLIQATHLVSTIARSGLVSQNSLETSLNSIFITNPDRTRDVYGGPAGVIVGSKIASDLILRFDLATHGDVIRYTLAVLQLERKLARIPECLREIGARVSNVDEIRMLDTDQEPIINSEVVNGLAQVYESTLGQLEPRIRVLGKQQHLQNSANINRIRALLLAALRSAVLWHQLGGRRWHLVFNRKPIAKALAELSYA
jgi:high frequency lysogenization protein